MSTWWREWRRVVLAAIVGAAVGAVVRGLLPPFVVDEGFWRDFLTGPPAAGLFALVGAGVAYAAARVAARTARRGAERQEWWNRAEWALNLARSDKQVDRLIGLRALEALTDEATQTEYALILAVTTEVTGDVDTGDATTENEARRWWPWNRSSK